MPAEPYGAAEIGPMPSRLSVLGVQCVRGQVRREVGAHRDRAHAGAAAAVRDAEGLVQVQVRHVATELARLGVAQQRVEVRTVDVDLAAVLVHDAAQLGDRLLVGAVGRGVGDHDRGQVVGVLLALRPQVVQVDRAVVTRSDDHDPHARHHRGGGVGAVRRARDQAHVTCGVAVGAVVAADGQQARELTLRAGVGLDGDPVVAGDLGQPLLELADELAVALRRPRRGRRGAGRRSRAARPAPSRWSR